MKSILISIKPKWVAKILNGEKTIEIRKTMPKCDLPIDVYIYCTKEEELFYSIHTQKWYVAKNRKNCHRLSNGIIKAKFTLDKVEEIKKTERHDIGLLEKSCLTATELYDYLFNKYTFSEICGYAWHIDNLVIFDRPKELSEFRKLHTPSYEQTKPLIWGEPYTQEEYRKDCERFGFILTKAPQNMVYVEVE